MSDQKFNYEMQIIIEELRERPCSFWELRRALNIFGVDSRPIVTWQQLDELINERVIVLEDDYFRLAAPHKFIDSKLYRSSPMSKSFEQSHV